MPDSNEASLEPQAQHQGPSISALSLCMELGLLVVALGGDHLSNGSILVLQLVSGDSITHGGQSSDPGKRMSLSTPLYRSLEVVKDTDPFHDDVLDPKRYEYPRTGICIYWRPDHIRALARYSDGFDHDIEETHDLGSDSDDDAELNLEIAAAIAQAAQTGKIHPNESGPASIKSMKSCRYVEPFEKTEFCTNIHKYSHTRAPEHTTEDS